MWGGGLRRSTQPYKHKHTLLNVDLWDSWLRQTDSKWDSRGLHVSAAWFVYLWVCSICLFLPPVSLWLTCRVDQYVALCVLNGSLKQSSYCHLCCPAVCEPRGQSGSGPGLALKHFCSFFLFGSQDKPTSLNLLTFPPFSSRMIFSLSAMEGTRPNKPGNVCFLFIWLCISSYAHI